jgi:2-isopropylmalate synthase
MKTEHSMDLPRRLQIEFSQVIQRHTDGAGGEVSAAQMGAIFTEEYSSAGTFALKSWSTSSNDGVERIKAVVSTNGIDHTLTGVGNGPIDAFCAALSEVDLGLGGVGVRVLDYAEHALTAGGDAEAVSYLELEVGERVLWGVGRSESIVGASLRAVISGLNRAARGREH